MPPNNTSASAIPLWQTLLFTLLTLIVFYFAQSVVLQHYISIQKTASPDAGVAALFEKVASDATAISLVSILSSIAASLFLLLIMHLRSLPIKLYLSLNTFSKRDFFNWLLVMFGLIAFMHLFAYAISHETSDFMQNLWDSADNVILLMIAVVIAAPIFEELLFRGFLFSGLQSSYLGTGVAIGFSSAAWAITHPQYGAFELITLFAFGILLAVSRVASRSILLPITLHAIFNLFAVLQMAIFH